MVAFGRGTFCTDAEPYYYDYLYSFSAGIPQDVADHIQQCAHCRTQIRQLEAAVAQSEALDDQARGDEGVLGALGLHFAHLGEDVTCAKAKSFLPVLLVPSLEIRIPTPITVHVDHCPHCAGDLEAIRELELRPEQLARLSRFYAEIADADPQMCRRTRAKTWAFACASFEGIDSETLDHMCTCPRCRRRVYRCREKILAGRQPGDTIPGVHLCNGISTADLFEWVVPYGRAGDDLEQELCGDEAMPAHLQACPECIEKMQALHCTIYSIAERVDSGVSTVYTTESRARTSGGAESLYCGHPVHVEVTRHDRMPGVTRFQRIAGIRETLGRTMATLPLRPILRAGALAAMIPLAILLLVNTRPASAIRVQGLFDALASIENLHLVRYDREGIRAVQELWVARSPELVVLKDARGDRLYDINRREKVVRYPGEGTVERDVLAQDELAGVEGMVESALRLLGQDVPSNEELHPLASGSVGEAGQGSAAYELTWEGESSHGAVVYYRLRAFLDPATRLPKRMESSRLTPDDEQWRPQGTLICEYPTRQKVELDIQGLFPEWRNHSGDHRGR